MRNRAIQLAVEAYAAPETWCSDDHHDTEIIYANGVYSVGTNGDVADYASADEAIEALVYQWDLEDAAQIARGM